MQTRTNTLEVGKLYVRRDKQIVYIFKEVDETVSSYRFSGRIVGGEDDGRECGSYTEDGSFWLAGWPDNADLMHEWPDGPDLRPKPVKKSVLETAKDQLVHGGHLLEPVDDKISRGMSFSHVVVYAVVVPDNGRTEIHGAFEFTDGSRALVAWSGAGKVRSAQSKVFNVDIRVK